MQWAGTLFLGFDLFATIGFHAEGNFFVNHPFTGSPFANDIDCLNFPPTVESNLLYQLHGGVCACVCVCVCVSLYACVHIFLTVMN